MAFVNVSEMVKKEKNIRVTDPVKATYTINKNQSTAVFQIDMYGSETRENPEKTSQVIAFDLQNLKDLIKLILKEFPSIQIEKKDCSGGTALRGPREHLTGQNESICHNRNQSE